MNLLVLMYHRARAGAYGNAPELLDRHFRLLATQHHVLGPGEPGVPGRLNVCLTFDDAYYDFYAVVLPLLERYNLTALLGVPAAFIRDEVVGSPEERLRLEHEVAFAEPQRGGFCTWPELTAIARSGRVRFAAHGYNHVRLDAPDADLDLEIEIDSPALLLRKRLGCDVDSFVFPFGRYTPAALGRAARHYSHIFRIGGAMNRSWRGCPLYRVDADGMATPEALLTPARLTQYRARYFWNRLRGR